MTNEVYTNKVLKMLHAHRTLDAGMQLGRCEGIVVFVNWLKGRRTQFNGLLMVSTISKNANTLNETLATLLTVSKTIPITTFKTFHQMRWVLFYSWKECIFKGKKVWSLKFIIFCSMCWLLEPKAVTLFFTPHRRHSQFNFKIYFNRSN